MQVADSPSARVAMVTNKISRFPLVGDEYLSITCVSCRRCLQTSPIREDKDRDIWRHLVAEECKLTVTTLRKRLS